MTIYEAILATYPELTTANFNPISGSILLKDDGDETVYITKWEYSKPLPKGMKVGKN
jgi:hypothetical protein